MLSNAILPARLVGTGDVLDSKKVESIVVVVLVEYNLFVGDIDSIGAKKYRVVYRDERLI